jgi:hypothetical protein
MGGAPKVKDHCQAACLELYVLVYGHIQNQDEQKLSQPQSISQSYFAKSHQ